jgi:hypothetical protein
MTEPEVAGNLSDPTVARKVADARRQDVARARRAIGVARTRYPGPVGEMLAQVMNEWINFGHLLGGHTLFKRLFDDLLGPDTGVVHRAEVEG